MEGIVAIIGRPNVGKSTLFNRLTRSNSAIVDDRPGVTRDRIYGMVDLNDDSGRGFTLIDTGGFETKDLYYQPFVNNIVWEQTEFAVQEADLVLLVLDARDGVHPHDNELARFLKKQGKDVIAVVNKIDASGNAASLDFYELGIETMLGVSAAHNRGVGDLREVICDRIRGGKASRRALPTDGNATRIAIIGRPNVGKSSLVNRLLGEERSLVSEIAGTTRDSIDSPLVYNKQQYVLVDTAGIRRRSKVLDKIETISVMRSLAAIDQADVVIAVLDATQGLADQDARLISLAADAYKPIVMVVNKWDLFEGKETNTARDYERAIHSHLKGLAFLPILFVSCAENQRVHKILAKVEEIAALNVRRVETARVNECLQKMIHEHTPALIRSHGKRIKFYYATQVAAKPPCIVVFCNVAEEIQESYKRYMQHRFREELGFDCVPIRLIFRDKKAVRGEDED